MESVWGQYAPLRAHGADTTPSGTIADFAAALRALRDEAGRPTYRQMARQARCSAATLCRAVAGDRLPSLEVVLGFVDSCHGDRAYWAARWRAAAASAQRSRLPDRSRPADPAGGNARAARPRQLPRAPADFVGRYDELHHLDKLTCVDAEDAPVVLVHGCGGVGKTALVVHWAVRHAARFPDGQLYVDLHGFDLQQPPLSPETAIGSLLRMLGAAGPHLPPDLDTLAALYRGIVTDLRLLVVLDNAAGTQQVLPLLAGAAGTVTLVTSRRRLGGFVARTGARRLSLGMFTAAESSELVNRVLGEAATRIDPAAIADLGDLCGHLPLAIRIAADQLYDQPSLSAGALAARLTDERYRLDALAVDDDIGVRSAFVSSYDALNPAAARALRLLALHRGPHVGVPAAAALLGRHPAEAVRILRVLCERHLLEEFDEGRFRLHDLLKIYASERLGAEEDPAAAAALTNRLLCWYLAGATAANSWLAPHRQPVDGRLPADAEQDVAFNGHAEALAWFDREAPNVVAAVHQAAAAGLDGVAWRLTEALWGFLELRKPWSDWHGTHAVGLAAARRCGDRRGEAALLVNLGLAHYYPRHFDQAETHFQQAAAIFQQEDDVIGAAVATNCLGNVRLERRELDGASRRYRRALTMLHDAPADGLRGVILTNLAETACLAGRPEEALQNGQDALDIHRLVGNRRLEATTLGHIANALIALARPVEARECLDEALRISRENGDRQAEAWTLHFLARFLHDEGHRDLARARWHSAVTLFDSLGDPQAETIRRQLAGTAEEPAVTAP